MIWQDIVALLIVIGAALALLRMYAPGIVRFGARGRDIDDSSTQSAASAGGCGDCSLGAACGKAMIKVHPGANEQHKHWHSANHSSAFKLPMNAV